MATKAELQAKNNQIEALTIENVKLRSENHSLGGLVEELEKKLSETSDSVLFMDAEIESERNKITVLEIDLENAKIIKRVDNVSYE